jgi:hypothetical protein
VCVWEGGEGGAKGRGTGAGVRVLQGRAF